MSLRGVYITMIMSIGICAASPFLSQVLASLRTVRGNFVALTHLQDRVGNK